MSVSRLYPLCLVLILGSPVLGGFPFAQYPDFRASAPSFSPHLIYGSGVGGNADFAGFSYFTKDFGGGESEVVFVTGPNSNAQMNDEVASMKVQMSSWPFINTAGTQLQDKKDDKLVENKDVSTTTAPVANEEAKESSTVKSEEAATTAVPKDEDKKDADITLKYLPPKGAGFETPYPIFRLSGSAAFYPQPSSTAFSGFPEFPTDYFRSQYIPLYNQYNSYQVPYVPSYPTLDADYYNPAVLPSLYQNPFVIPSVVGGNSVEDKTSSDVIAKVDRRFKEENEFVAPTPQSDSDKKTGDDSTSTSEKGTEVPTSTEEIVEKSTTVSETAPTTTEETKENTTAVDNDTVALS